jgi:periplasmic divalent cation tolerance protein
VADFCQLWLTCKDKHEADKIANSLLGKHLIACARQVPVTSDYLWKDKVEHSIETMLLMESRLDLFDKVETEIAKLHSYDTFVLEAIPVSRVSKGVVDWLKQELQNVLH